MPIFLNAQSVLVKSEVSWTETEQVARKSVLARIDNDRASGVIIRERYVRLNSHFEQGSEILFDLFPNYTGFVNVHRTEIRKNDDYSCFGRMNNDKLSAVIMVVKEGRVTANIRIEHRLFQIRPMGDGIHSIMELDLAEMPLNCDTDESDSEIPNYQRDRQPPNPNLIPNNSTAGSPYTEGFTVDILIVYTADAAAGSADIAAEVQLMIDETNDALERSGSATRTRLIHSAEITYTESGSSSTDLNRLSNPIDGYMDDAHTWRDSYGADLVALIVESLPGACGRGNLATTTSGYDEWAYTVTRRDCAVGNLSFPHEIGHNMGCRHDWYVDPTNNSPFTYNHGYKVVAEGWRTIMSYNNECSDNSTYCTRLAYFSNPDTLHPTHGSAMGIPEGMSNAADNAKVWDMMGAAIAAYRSNASSPVINIQDASVVEGDAGSTSIEFTVYLSASPTVAVSVDYYTADSTAVEPGDYTNTTGTVNFAIGDSVETFTIPIIGDLSDEDDEYFKAIITNPTNGVVSDSVGVGTIYDDENIPDIDVSPLSFNVTLLADSMTTGTVTISNLGDVDLTYSIKEAPTTEALTKRSFRFFREANPSDSPTATDYLPLKHTGISEPGNDYGSLSESTQFSDSIYYDNYPGSYTNFGTGGPNPFYFATKYTTSSAFTLTHVRSRYRTQSSSADIEVVVYENNSGNPGSVLYSETFSGAEYLHSSSEWELFELASPVSFSSGEEFWIAMHFMDVPYPMNTTTTTSIDISGRMRYSSSGSFWSDLHSNPSWVQYAWIIRALEAVDLEWVSLSSTSNTISALGSDDITLTFDASGLSAGTYTGELQISSNDPDESTVTVPLNLTVSGPASVAAKVFLEGAYDSTTTSMNTYLYDGGLLPLSQPFSGSPWNYSGTESVASIPADVVDWILIKLRSASGAESEVSARAAFVKDDGTVIDTSGSSVVSFGGVTPGDYYVCIYHRNHLGIMSASKVTLTESSTMFDFTTASSQSYGISPTKQVGSSGPYCMRSGDGNSDGGVDALDKNLIWRAQNGGIWNYTSFGDFNLDGGIDALDLNLHWRMDNGEASQIPGVSSSSPQAGSTLNGNKNSKIK